MYIYQYESVCSVVFFLLFDVVNLQPVEILTHLPFDTISPNALEEVVDLLEDSQSNVFGLHQLLQLALALKN